MKSAAAAAAAGNADGAPPPTGLESEMADLVAAIAAAELTTSTASAAVPSLLPPRLAVERLPAGDAPAVVAPPTAVLTPAVEPVLGALCLNCDFLDSRRTLTVRGVRAGTVWRWQGGGLAARKRPRAGGGHARGRRRAGGEGTMTLDFSNHASTV